MVVCDFAFDLNLFAFECFKVTKLIRYVGPNDQGERRIGIRLVEVQKNYFGMDGHLGHGAGDNHFAVVIIAGLSGADFKRRRTVGFSGFQLKSNTRNREEQ